MLKLGAKTHFVNIVLKESLGKLLSQTISSPLPQAMLIVMEMIGVHAVNIVPGGEKKMHHFDELLGLCPKKTGQGCKCTEKISF